MDLAGCAADRRALIPIAVLLVLYIIPLSYGQNSPSDAVTKQAQQLAAEQRWQEIVCLVEPVQSRSSDLDLYYGTALAHLERLDDARQAFQAGARLAPTDNRFPLELAGLAFKQKQYPQASRYLRRGLRLRPDDAYGDDFLGTVYFLEGSLEAALKYWNRAGKPQLAAVQTEPTPRVDAALLDRAFAFSSASMLQLPEFLTTETRIGGWASSPAINLT